MDETTQTEIDIARKRGSGMPLPFVSKQTTFFPTPSAELHLASKTDGGDDGTIHMSFQRPEMKRKRSRSLGRARSSHMERDRAGDGSGVGLLLGRALSIDIPSAKHLARLRSS